MIKVLKKLDRLFTSFTINNSGNIARISLFIIYFWFGILKIFSLSPASNLVEHLFNKTLAWTMSFSFFYLAFSLFEIAIGISFLFPKLFKLSFYVSLFHILMTMMPIVLLPNEIWISPLVPTLEGQYILKNLILISLILLINTTRQSGNDPHRQKSIKERNITKN